MAKNVVKRSSFVVHDRVPYVDEDGRSMTRQEFTDECDVNKLMERYQKVGVWPLPMPNAEPRYLDVSAVPDFAAAMQMMIDAENAFMTLPAITRREFDNDPTRFVEFAQNSENLPKMREWGLAPPEAVADPPMRVEVVNPPGAEAGEPAKP